MSSKMSARLLRRAASVICLAILVGSAFGCKKTESEKPATSPTAGQAVVVNSLCPVMGTLLDRNNVPELLTRQFQGKKVGFCCPKCPVTWDKLSDSEREEKLQIAMSPKK